mmetsp:Transcript_8811/g.17684  ORF Transcript_8811/g.17684 Transcript_8811/m.17684 type:complete len:555 (-) Transcript_8811:38-1702(-)
MTKICVKNANTMCDAALAASSNLGWRVVLKEKSADILMHSQATANALVVDITTIKPNQKVSKIPGSSHVAKKHVLADVFSRASKIINDSEDSSSFIEEFWPKTYSLPADLDEVRSELNKNKKRKKKKTLILKPSDGSQGEGISLLQTPSDLKACMVTRSSNAKSVVQEYLPAPLLLPAEPFKFDLRIYVLVRSVEPLEIYLCKEGLVRFATSAYEKPQRSNLSDVMKHLTNYSLNKRSGEYIHNDGKTSGGSGDEEEEDLEVVADVVLPEDDPHEEVGSKRTLTSLLKTLQRTHPDFDKEDFFQNLVNLSMATVKAMQPSLVSSTRSLCGDDEKAERMLSGQCFQIYGLDVLVDERYRTWLLEVNGNPSMRLDHEVCNTGGSGSDEGLALDHYVPSIVDECVKGIVMKEALKIVDEGFEGAAEHYIDVSGTSTISEGLECLDIIGDVTAHYAAAFSRGRGGEDNRNKLTLSLFRRILAKFREEKGGIGVRGMNSLGADADLAYQRWDLDRRKKKGDDFDVWCDLWDFYDALVVIAKLVGVVGRNDYEKLSAMLK